MSLTTLAATPKPVDYTRERELARLGSEAGAAAALERAAAELVAATALSVVRPTLRGVR